MGMNHREGKLCSQFVLAWVLLSALCANAATSASSASSASSSASSTSSSGRILASSPQPSTSSGGLYSCVTPAQPIKLAEDGSYILEGVTDFSSCTRFNFAVAANTYVALAELPNNSAKIQLRDENQTVIISNYGVITTGEAARVLTLAISGLGSSQDRFNIKLTSGPTTQVAATENCLTRTIYQPYNNKYDTLQNTDCTSVTLGKHYSAHYYSIPLKAFSSFEVSARAENFEPLLLVLRDPQGKIIANYSKSFSSDWDAEYRATIDGTYSLEVISPTPAAAIYFQLRSQVSSHSYEEYQRTLPLCTINKIQLPSSGSVELNDTIEPTFCLYWNGFSGVSDENKIVYSFTLQPNQKLEIENPNNWEASEKFYAALSLESWLHLETYFYAGSPKATYFNGPQAQEMAISLMQNYGGPSRLRLTTTAAATPKDGKAQSICTTITPVAVNTLSALSGTLSASSCPSFSKGKDRHANYYSMKLIAGSDLRIEARFREYLPDNSILFTLRDSAGKVIPFLSGKSVDFSTSAQAHINKTDTYTLEVTSQEPIEILDYDLFIDGDNGLAQPPGSSGGSSSSGSSSGGGDPDIKAGSADLFILLSLLAMGYGARRRYG